MAKTKHRFTCTKCGRTFRMPAHLGRHLATIHGTKTRRAAARPTASRRTGGAPGGALARVVRELQSCRGTLLAERAALDARMDAVGTVLTALEGTATSSGRDHRRIKTPVNLPGATTWYRRGRGRRGPASSAPGSLKAYIERALRGARGPIRVGEITAAVLNAGYQTRSKRLAKRVWAALAKLPGVRKAGRGLFRMA
jgi:hypothetical protein